MLFIIGVAWSRLRTPRHIKNAQSAAILAAIEHYGLVFDA